MRFIRRGHTIAYAAPESFSGRFSAAQDWWAALGMVVRQFATGKPLFAGLSEQVAMHELLVQSIARRGDRRTAPAAVPGTAGPGSRPPVGQGAGTGLARRRESPMCTT